MKVLSEITISLVTLAAKEKQEGRAIGVKRSKEHGDIGDILSVIFVEDTMTKLVCI